MVLSSDCRRFPPVSSSTEKDDMNPLSAPTRRDLLLTTVEVTLGGTTATAAAAEPSANVYRIGVISAAINGKPQPRNGHTWHFAQYLHPTCDFDALKKHYLQ